MDRMDAGYRDPPPLTRLPEARHAYARLTHSGQRRASFEGCFKR